MLRKLLSVILVLGMLCSLTVFSIPAFATETSRTYTLDADFEEGDLLGVEYDTIHDQLQLSAEQVILPFIWVPNSNEGTVSKYDTITGKELGRYRTGPTSGGNPSRTTVDQNGDVWFGNRNTGTVVKIGLYEAGHWVDKNNDGICQTSTDLNNDGKIIGAEVLPWGDDECVLFEVLCGNSGSGPRGIAINANNDLWAGTYTLSGGNKFYHIDGSTGAIIPEDTINLYGSGYSYASYGAIFDANGYLWSSCLSNYVLKIDTATKSITRVSLSITSYGIGIDDNSHLFVASWGQGQIAKIDVNTATVLQYADQGAASSRGVCVSNDGDVWVVNSYETKLTRLNNDLVIKATIDIGSSGISTGAAVDAAGKIWTCNYDDGYLHRIDPATNEIDFSVQTPGISGSGVGQHYSYSDMTGYIARNITTKTGTWTVVFDSEMANMPWGNVSWNSQEPEGTSVTVNVRSSNDQLVWSDWEGVTNGVSLSETPNGQYLQIETTLRINSGETSPILYDLTVEVGNLPPLADAGADQQKEQSSYAGAEFTLDGSGSTDDGQIAPITYEWTLADGTVIGNEAAINYVFPLGVTTATLTVSDGQLSDSDEVDIKVVDTTPPVLTCVQATNPSGKNVPTAGKNSKSGQNPDGFYQLSVIDICDSAPVIYVGTAENPKLFGPFESGVIVKFTQAKGATPSCEMMGSGNPVIWHIILPTDPVVTAYDLSGNSATCVGCLVPPSPK